MVSERRLHAKRPMPSTHQKALTNELNCKSPQISSISSIASFREKKFKKTASAAHSNFASRKKASQKSQGAITGRTEKPALDHSRASRRKSGVAHRKNGRSDQSPHVTVSKQFHHHSPRAFSLFTLQEYLHEKSHAITGVSMAVHEMNSDQECDMNKESSYNLHLLNSSSTDAIPLLPSDLPRSYTRKPRQNAADHCINSSVSQCKCNEPNCQHVELKPDLRIASISKDGVESDDSDDDDKMKEALSVDQAHHHHHGCAPWQSFSSLTPKHNKKQILMELAGRSFACGGFPASRRYYRAKTCAAPIEKAYTSTGGAQWETLSSSSGSDAAPLLSDQESEVCNDSMRARCYPACNSIPCIMRRKSQDNPNTDGDMQSNSLRHNSRRGHEKGNEHGGGRYKTGQSNNATSRKKGSAAAGIEADGRAHTSSDRMETREKICETSFGSLRAAKTGEKHRSLSEKYRPRRFGDMVGQNMVTQALSNAVTKKRIALVYLFQGPRGTGKTSAAKIFAASINCSDKGGARPCGCCRNCEGICAGKSSILMREVDASGNNGVEDMRSLMSFVSSGSHHSKVHKVLIIDECHMLAREAWNLFLSILENPPLSVVFILITTNSEQIPRMVLSKCQKFAFTKIRDADLLSRLQGICDAEHIDIESDALQLIASRSDGSLYDAESTLDQLANLGQKITSSIVREMVGLVAEEKLAELLEGAMRGDSVKTVRSLRELMQAGIEPLALMSQLATLITDLLAGNFNPTATQSPSSSNPSDRLFTSQPLGKVELEKLRQALRILSEAEKQLRSCNNRTTWLTAALLQFSPPDALDAANHHPHVLDTLPSSSLAGTSLTQSPIILLDTSEKETADPLCSTVDINAKVKSPWNRNPLWQAGDETKKLHAGGRPPTLSASSTDKPETVDANEHINLHGKISEMDAAEDAFVYSSYGAYFCNSSPQRKDTRGESVESGSREPSCFDYSSRNKNSSRATPSSMDDIWRKVLEGSVFREILSGQGRLLSLSVSEAYAVAHLEFRLVEDKRRAEKAKSSISKAFQTALGCPVEVKLSLAPSKAGEAKVHMKSKKGGVKERGQQAMNQKHRRTRKAKLRSKRACCNEVSLYYSRHQRSFNSSVSHSHSHSHSRLGNYYLANGLYINARVSSSDESFTNWTQASKLDMGSSTTSGLRGIGIGNIRAYDRVDPAANKKRHDEREYVGFDWSGSPSNQYIVETCDDDVLHKSSHDLLYAESLRVERPDSPGFASQSFNEYVLEYDRIATTPAFRTGFLCWKGSATNTACEAKVRHRYRRRRRRKTAPPLMMGCVPCAHAR